MKERVKRVKRGDGSVYRSKSKQGRWGTEGRGVERGLERGRDWSRHETWVGKVAKKAGVAKKSRRVKEGERQPKAS